VLVHLRLPALAAALGAGVALLAVPGPSHAGAARHAAKKRCHLVVRKVRGNARRVRVCTEVPKRKPPAPTPSADLVLVAVAPLEVTVGQEVDYRLTVLNRGPRVAWNVTVAVDTPIGLETGHTSLSPAEDATCDSTGTGPTAFRCRLAALPVNGRWILEFAGTPSAAGKIRFAAAVRSSTPDPTARNAAAQVVTTVDPAPAPPPTRAP
jgi:hypothetical protein